VQGDRNRLLAVLRFTAAASAGFEFAMLVLVHDALDSFLLSRALTGHELSSFAVHTARATNEMLYKFLNRRMFIASKCRFLLEMASFLHREDLQSAKCVMVFITETFGNATNDGAPRFVANRQRPSKSQRFLHFADLRAQSRE
jgi:hypothetical protein